MRYGRDKFVTVGTHVIVLYKVTMTANNLDCIMKSMPSGQGKMYIGYRKLMYFLSLGDSTENLEIWSGYSWRRHPKGTDRGHEIYRIWPVVIEY